jgi:hypothetical protein
MAAPGALTHDAGTRQDPVLERRFSHRLAVKSRYPDDPLAPVRRRPAAGGLAGGVDPVGFPAGVGEGSVGFDRVMFDRMDSQQFAVF